METTTSFPGLLAFYAAFLIYKRQEALGTSIKTDLKSRYQADSLWLKNSALSKKETFSKSPEILMGCGLKLIETI